MAYKINIRNQANTAWINLLEAIYIEVADTGTYFTGTTVEDVLAELYVNKVKRVTADGAPTAANDGASGYPMGTLWVDPNADKVYISVNENTGAAIWIDVSSIDQEGIEDTVGNMFPGTNVNITSAYNDVNGKIDLTIATATDAVLGVSSFSNLDFDVAGGAVSVKDASITVAYLSSSIDATAIDFDAAKVNGTAVLDTGITTSDLWTASKIVSYVDSIASGLFWQESVIDKDLNDPPVAPAFGDRYIVSWPVAAATGLWLGQDNTIAEWDGTAWQFTAVAEGMATWIEDEDVQYVWNGSSWAKLGTTLTHSNLIGLQGGNGSTELYHLTSAESSSLIGSKAANTFFASPNGSAGVGGFRVMVPDDVPSLLSTKISDFTEAAQDAAGALITTGTATNMTAVYDDASNAINFAIPAATVSTLGVASFATSNFTVTGGAVSIKDGGISHGGLANLTTADDHSQYVHISVNRTITAQHTFAPATAIAPFLLNASAQGVLVTGFNADLLNGQDWTIAATASAPPTPAVNDIWVEITV